MMAPKAIEIKLVTLSAQIIRQIPSASMTMSPIVKARPVLDFFDASCLLMITPFYYNNPLRRSQTATSKEARIDASSRTAAECGSLPITPNGTFMPRNDEMIVGIDKK